MVLHKTETHFVSLIIDIQFVLEIVKFLPLCLFERHITVAKILSYDMLFLFLSMT